jgi:hypothetical protein
MMFIPSVIMLLSVVYADCHNYVHYAESHCAEYRGAIKHNSLWDGLWVSNNASNGTSNKYQ